jgi:general secretion pathway protein G
MESGTVIGDLRTRMEMERMGETVTGRQGEESPARPVSLSPRLFSPRRPVSLSPRLLSRGFTLLELMIVISIIIILAAITLPQFQKTILHTREAVLRDDLNQMRKLIDQFAADKGKLPQSLDDLVSEGYMREVPVDPFTGQKDWAITTGEDPNSSEGEQGMTDIHSSSGDVSSEGTPYSEW